ncbi:MAG: NTP transferase domain-containing protein [Clostridiales bacterium]|nr:NTP transferase domain-containing protein [Clostridiales bacterium]
MRAVIMAGGEGSRLRPLTCDIPKPMARLCGRPVIEYIFDLLIKNGVEDVDVSLGYLPEVIYEKYSEGKYRSLNLNFVTEETPMGTAGGVRFALSGSTSEPFIVISGDAMCDFDLAGAVRFHNRNGAAATLIGTRVEDPREYGLIHTDASGRITGFTEKPPWGQATVNLANTGIYIIGPECLEMIPKDKKYDFSKDLFPKMLERKMPLFCCESDGYWCDIGDIEAYLKCQRDMLDGRIKCGLRSVSGNIFCKDKLPAGNYKIEPPVYLGEQVEIGNDAVLGPYAVIDDGCFVGDVAKIRSSVMLPNSYAAGNVSATGAIMCSGSTSKRGASLFEGSVLGAGSTLGAGSSVKPGKLIWPEKNIESFMTVNENVKYGHNGGDIFGDHGIGGDGGVELTPEICAEIGEAVGSIKSCRRAGIGCDGTIVSKMIMYSIISGIMAAGGHIWSFGECFETQLSFLTSFCGLETGIFIKGTGTPEIKVCSEGGLTIPRNLEREIEKRLVKKEFNRCSQENLRDVADMSGIKMMYCRELMRQAPYELRNVSADIQCSNEFIKSILKDAMLKLYCGKSDRPCFKINESGTDAAAFDEDGTLIPFEKLLAVCCCHEMKNGNDIALPFDAPYVMESLASAFGRKVFRYLSSPADNSDSAARRLAAKQLWVRDGLFLTVRTLSIMNEERKTLKELLREIPDFYVEKKSYILNVLPSQLSEIIGDRAESPEKIAQGLLLKKENGRLLITPSRSGKLVNVIAEADKQEIAGELCADIENILDKSIVK